MATKCPKCREIGEIDDYKHDAINEVVIWYMVCMKCALQWEVYFEDGVAENIQTIGG